MTVRKLVPYSLLLLTASAALGLAAATMPDPADKPPAPKPVPLLRIDPPAPAKAEAKPRPVGPNRILFWRNGQLVTIDPDGKNEKAATPAGDFHPSGALLSPDGKLIAIAVPVDPPAPLPPRRVGEAAQKRTAVLHVRGIDEKGSGTSLGVECVTFAWSPDGTEIACSDFEDGPDRTPKATHTVVNVKTKNKTDLKVPDSQIITDWFPDGKSFLTTRISKDKEKPEARLYVVDRGAWHFHALTDDKQLAMLGKLSPDGKRVLYTTAAPPPKDKPGPTRRELNVLDVETRKSAKVGEVPLNAEVHGYCWSPDGKRIAYTWRQLHEGKPEDVVEKETESHLVVCDPDGKNQKTLVTEKGKGQWIVTLGGVDWR